MLLTLAVCGCLPHTVPPPLVCPPPPAFLAPVLARQGEEKALSALVEMDIQALGKRYPVQAALMVKGPGSLRLETIPPIGPPDVLLSIEDDRLRVYLLPEGTLYIGSASRHLDRFVPLPFAAGDLVALLRGVHPPLRAGDCLLPEEEISGGIRQVHVMAPDGRRRMSLGVSVKEGTLVRLQVDGDDDRAGYTAVFSEHLPVDGIALPGRIVIRGRGPAGLTRTVSLRYTDMEWVEAPPPDTFDLPSPPGAVPVQLNSISFPAVSIVRSGLGSCWGNP